MTFRVISSQIVNSTRSWGYHHCHLHHGTFVSIGQTNAVHNCHACQWALLLCLSVCPLQAILAEARELFDVCVLEFTG